MGGYPCLAGFWDRPLGFVYFGQLVYWVIKEVVANNRFDWLNYNESDSKYLQLSNAMEICNKLFIPPACRYYRTVMLTENSFPPRVQAHEHIASYSDLPQFKDR